MGTDAQTAIPSACSSGSLSLADVATPVLTATEAYWEQRFEMVALNVDGDAYDDLALVARYDIQVLIATGAGSWSGASTSISRLHWGAYAEALAGPTRGTGVDDLVVLTGGKITMYTNNDAGSLDTPFDLATVSDRFGKLLTDDNDNDVAVALAQTAELWAAETGFPYETNLAALFADDAAALPPLAPPSSNLLRTMPVSDVIHDRDWVDELVGMLAPDAAAALAAHDDAYLDSLVVTYHRFLFLAAKYPRDRYVSVALDCDLVWHAHQLFPSRYEQDCLRLLGQPLPHLPWPVHTPAEEADNSATLDSAWRDTFGVPFGTRPTVASD